MHNRYFLNSLLVILCVAMVTITFPDGPAALLVVAALATAAILIFRRFTTEREFLTYIFLFALLVRLGFGIFIHVFDLRDFFGPDAHTYHEKAVLFSNYISGRTTAADWALQRQWVLTGPGWGMSYLIMPIYLLFGPNILASQSFCAVFGAATAPMAYFCSLRMFANKRVAKFAAVAIALFPSFVIWSSQLMKDGLIIFLLVLTMTMVLQLQEKFSYAALAILVFALFGIISLRFYIFYMVAIAVAGSFIVGLSSSIRSIARRTIAMIVIGLALTYLGVLRNASVDLERYGTLESVQVSRQNLATAAGSGFGEDIDVSTAEGAISAVPTGFIYLMLAPFPWSVSNFRQAITLPEVLVWWAMIPLMAAGLWYAVRHRLRSTLSVLLFSMMLTLAYSIFQGNVGTAYRQRTQIQVFLFIFVAVGWQLYRERKEDRELVRNAKRRRLERQLQARVG
jgi:hypothetical protein